MTDNPKQRLQYLHMVKDTIRGLDETLRKKSICPVCGKPKDGIVLTGSTPEKSGLCTGHPKEEHHE